jgi:hypothetical protein
MNRAVFRDGGATNGPERMETEQRKNRRRRLRGGQGLVVSLAVSEHNDNVIGNG